MKKTLLFVAGFMALALGFFSCEKEPTTTTTTPEPEVIPGWEKVFMIDTDPDSFATDGQVKFQFKISGFDYPADAKIEFYFSADIEDFSGKVCFRSVNTNEKWIDGDVPAEIEGETASGTGTVTKIDDKWYKVSAIVAAADNALGFTFYKNTEQPKGNDKVYVKGFVISYTDETGELVENDYYSEDFVYDEEYNHNPLKIEPWYAPSAGLRVTEVDAF